MTTHVGIARIIRTAALLVALAGLGAPAAMAQPVDPTTDPFPVFDTDDPTKSIDIRLRFRDRFDATVDSVSVVRERPRARAADPPLLHVDVVDVNGVTVEAFNAWHPQWEFVEKTDTPDGGESLVLRSNAVGSLLFFFQGAAAEARVTDVPTGTRVATVNLTPETHAFCRSDPDDPECDGLANRPPSCDAGGPYEAQCAGAATSVDLDGSSSSDPDGDPIVRHAWTGPFAGGTVAGAAPRVTLTGAGEFSIDLTVTDDFGAASSCAAPVRIVFGPASLPTLNCRLATLLAQVQALGKARPMLEPSLLIAVTRKEDAERAVASGDVRRAAKLLKSTGRRMTVFEHRVRSLTGRNQLSSDQSGTLLAASAAIIADLGTVATGL
jgi:hypothetical protein